MANLSAYIDFTVVLQKDVDSSSLVLSDPDNYPPGVDVNLKGYFIVTQPDGIIITGNYLTPDIYWNGSQLTTATKELRLRSTGGFQQGEYTFTYNIVAPGYDETTLTKTFDLSYTSPTITIDENFDVFTPVLNVTDNTSYTQAGMTLDNVVRSWEATIISVEGTNQDISAGTQIFDLSYLGAYYDSRYDVSLTATATYTLDSADDWVQVSDQQFIEATYYAFNPPTIIELLEMLTAYKAIVDAKNCICGTGAGCCGNCDVLKSTYSLAVSIYSHVVSRGKNDLTDGLGDYVLQLRKLLNNCTNPPYTNTNEVINPYDWGNPPPLPTLFAFYKQMVVGSGVNNAPADGATSYTDANLIGKNVVVYLDSLLMGNGLGDRISISYDIVTGTISWNTSLYSPQLISIFTYS